MSPSLQTSPVLVLGATGSFGAGAAAELLRRDVPLRCLARHPDKTQKLLGKHERLEIIPGDVQDAAGLVRAAEGCAVIVHAINYPYDQWIPHMQRATANVIAAARAARATILFPGTVYNLGEQTDAPLREDAPSGAKTRKGALRAELEDELRKATEDGGVQVIILRAGDFFGPTARNGLVDPIFGNAAHGKTLQIIGNPRARHEWVFVPDLARAAAGLLEIRERLKPFEIFHYGGYVPDSQRDFLRLVARQAGHPNLKFFTVPWFVLRVMGWFNPVMKELLELRYLFDRSVILDGSRLRRLLPDFQPTPLERAVQTTVESYR